jgi:hypothetical protein
MRNHVIQSMLWALVVVAPMAVHAQAPQGAVTQAESQEADDKSTSKFTFEGEAALWTVAIRPDKTADFEKVLGKLHQVLTTTDKPELRKQGEGWTVLRLSTPLPDGNIAYVHDVRPVISGADYSVMRILYDAFPDESRQLYELYRGAFVRNVALATGSVVMNAESSPAGDSATTPPAPSSAAPAPQTTQTPQSPPVR